MATRPLRLRKVLSEITGNQWQFALNAGGSIAYDDDIYSVTITRGTSSGRNVGHKPTTFEVDLTGRRDTFATGSLCRFFLRDSVAAALASYVGTTKEKIAQRYKGRLATIELEDNGGDNFTTKMTASSWLTQMNYSPASWTATAGEDLGMLMRDITKSEHGIRGIEFATTLGAVNIHNFALREPELFPAGVSELADIGVTFQELRDGSTMGLGIPYRVNIANTRVNVDYPLMRNQAIAPGQYGQYNERPAIRVEFKITNEAGGAAVRVAEVSNPTGELRETVSVDWSQWQVEATANQLVREAYAKVFESSARLFALPTVKIDMLMLLKNGGVYARRIARQILELEVSEPIFLSGDWPEKIRGVHFAEGIKETITPTSWEFELSLVPHAVATGITTPGVEPRAWDSFTYDWDSETRSWDNT
ncbi:minor tail protein [Arthrobacter phage MooKitty]|nr:minor tail protein [Arthrobacter phage MooKitty]